MFNLVVLTGRLTATPELKTSVSGLNVCSFSIAVERPYKSGEDKQVDFINCIAWRQTANFISKYFTKGKMIGIEGCIRTRKYTDKEGNNRNVFEILVDTAQFVDMPTNNTPKADTGENLEQFAEKLKQAEKSSGVDIDVAIDDDGDLPF